DGGSNLAWVSFGGAGGAGLGCASAAPAATARGGSASVVVRANPDELMSSPFCAGDNRSARLGVERIDDETMTNRCRCCEPRHRRRRDASAIHHSSFRRRRELAHDERKRLFVAHAWAALARGRWSPCKIPTTSSPSRSARRR